MIRKKYFSRSGATAQSAAALPKVFFAPLRRCGRNIFLSFRITAATQTEGFHLPIQPGPVVVEDLGGAFDVSTGPLERLRNRFTLDLFHREIGRNNATEFCGVSGVKLLR